MNLRILPMCLCMALLTLGLGACSDSSDPISSGGSSSGTTVPLTLTTTSLANATKDVPYTQALAASGGQAPYTFSVLEGASLPAGMQLNSSGQLGGQISHAGSFEVFVTVRDSSMPPLSVTRRYTLSVAESNLLLPLSSLPSAILGQEYSVDLTPTNGTAPYLYEVLDGATDDGAGNYTVSGAGTIRLNANGRFSGRYNTTPLSPFARDLTIRVSDSSTPARTVTRAFTLHVSNVPSFAARDLPIGLVGSLYEASVSLSGGDGLNPAVWSLLTPATMPAGLSLGSDGSIQGTPNAAGIWQLDLSATARAFGAIPLMASATLIVNDPVTSTYVADTREGSGNNTRATANMLPAPNSSMPWVSASPLTIDTTSDAIDWYAFQLNQPAGVIVDLFASESQLSVVAYVVSVIDGEEIVVDSASTTGQQLTLDVPLLETGTHYLVVEPQLFSSGGTSYSLRVRRRDLVIAEDEVSVDLNGGFFVTEQLTALVAGLPVSGATFSVVSGSLPTGITLSSNGLLSGSPLAMGLYRPLLRVTYQGVVAERVISFRLFDSTQGNYWEVLGDRRVYDSASPIGNGSLIDTYADASVVAPHPDYADGAIYVIGGRGTASGINQPEVYVYHTDDMVSGNANRIWKYEDINRNLPSGLRYFGAAFLQHSFGGYIYVVGGDNPSEPTNPHSTGIFTNNVMRLQVSDGTGAALATPGTWQSVASLPATHPVSGNGIRGWAEFALVANDDASDANDRLFLVGGRYDGQLDPINDPTTYLQYMNEWVLMYQAPTALAGLGSWFIKNDVAPYTPRRFPATAWINGSIYIAGGRTALAGMFGGIEMVTPSLISGNASIANAVSSQFPTLPSAVYVMASATRSNQLLMVGGWNNSFADTNRFTSFTPGTNGLGGQLMQMPPLDFGTGFGSAVVLGDKFYVLSGVGHSGFHKPTVLRYHFPAQP